MSSLEIRPRYAERFRCTGAACQDSCCHHWSVPVDQAALVRIGRLPDLPLGALLRASLVPIEGAPGSGPNAPVARIHMTEAQRCPMLATDGLCRLHSECGEQALPHVCQTYPRIHIDDHGARETALIFSCPEAARLVLLDPDLRTQGLECIESTGQDSPQLKDKEHARQPAAHFFAVRRMVLSLIGSRAYPLWQRMFLLNLLCHRLEQVADGRLDATVPDFLRAFEEVLRRRSLVPAMEALPHDHSAQLDLVLHLAGSMLRVGGVLPGFAQTVSAFTNGIGNGPGATLQTLVEHYERAHDNHFAPFFDARPHILENYLINTVFRCRFPFGARQKDSDAEPSLIREYDKLLAQFALIKGLLIGVSGHYGAQLSTGHVLHTFQSAAKHFEHHPEFFDRALGIMAECGLAGGTGSAILARNRPTPHADQKLAIPEIHSSMPLRLQTETGPA